MAERYLLDTDIASYAIERKSETLRLKLRHIEPGTLCISAVSVAEMLYGLKALPWNHPLIVQVHNFIDIAITLNWDLQAAQAYADIRHSLARSGRPIKDLDMMIAAHAIATDSILVTNHTRHFQRLSPPLRLENWTEA
jgi:tRNA(fMet)-specific endonuclease VapC